jgi:hypothetical protein
MADKYWIKLYHEILDDPKMALLPDHLWRFTIELFLLAGKNGDDGSLPEPKHIAWMLRRDIDEITNNLKALVETGIITVTDNGYVVTKFEKRQSPSGGAERVQRYRDAKQKDQYYCNENVTKRYTSALQTVTQNQKKNQKQNTDTEEEEGRKPAASPSPSNFPFDVDEKRVSTILMNVTGNMFIPQPQADFALPIVHAIEGKVDDITDYLKTYWYAWRARGYSKTNYSWLEWAAAGEIPGKKSEPVKQYTDAEYAEFAKELP